MWQICLGYFRIFKTISYLHSICRNNRIEKEAWTSIIDSIGANDYLDTLILSGNYLTPEEAVLLSEARDNNSTLVRVLSF